MWCCFQIRRTEASLKPCARAMVRVLQWVASEGFECSVASTTSRIFWGDILALSALGCQANNPRPLHQPRRDTSRSRPPRQGGSFLRGQHNGCCTSAHAEQHRIGLAISKDINDALH